MAEIKFFTNPMSRGQIARWALHEVDADYEQILLEYGGSMKGAEFLAVNPMGKVPTIQHGEAVVTEAAAICAYLGAAFPAKNLAPRPEELADYYRWLFFCAGPVESAVTMHSMQWAPSEEQQAMIGFGSYEQTVNVLESAVGRSDYICGDRFTMADVYVGSQVDWGIGFGTLPTRDAFTRYAERIREREAYKAAKAIDGALIAERSAAGDESE